MKTMCKNQLLIGYGFKILPCVQSVKMGYCAFEHCLSHGIKKKKKSYHITINYYPSEITCLNM